MKRQRRVDGGGGGGSGGGAAMNQGPGFEGATTAMKMANKKAKKTVERAWKEEARIDGGEHQLGFVAAESLMVGDENYWGRLSGCHHVVDEQMSWGSIWLPFWDVEFMGEAHYGLFSDVMWDDDIWGLRTNKEIPNP